MVRKFFLLLTSLTLGLVSLSCESLPELDLDMCGNWVIEEGESCDRPEEEDEDSQFSEFRCGLPSGPPEQACRFVCGQGDTTCPGGWNCDALTGTCRYPSGELILAAGPTGPPARNDITLTDLLGNSRLQLVESDNVQVSLRAGLLGGGLDSRTTIPSPGLTAPVAIGTLKGSDDSDVESKKMALATSSGVVVYEVDSQGRAFGEPFPANSTISEEAYHVELFKLPEPCAGAGLLSYQRSGADTLICVGAAGIDGQRCEVLSPEFSQNSGEEIVVATEIFSGRGDALILGYVGASVVDLFEIRVSELGSCFDIDGYTLERIQSIELADGFSLAGAPSIGDMNGDGAVDIVLPVETSSIAGPSWQIALQDVDTATFGSPQLDEREVTRERCPIELPNGRDVSTTELKLLSLGDYNNDGIADITSDKGVLLSREPYLPGASGGLCLVFAPAANRLFKSALSLDLNRDEILDLIEIYEGTTILGVSVSNGRGLFSRTLVELEATVKDIEAGDFDADGFKDLAILGEDGKVMIWAGGQDIATTVQTVSEVPEGQYLSAGIFNVFGYEPDARSDILVVAPSDVAELKVYPLFGTASRFLISPFRPDVDPALAEDFTALPTGIAIGELGDFGSGLLAVYLDTSAVFIPYDATTQRLDAEAARAFEWPEPIRPLGSQVGIQMLELNDRWIVFRPGTSANGRTGDTHVGVVRLQHGQDEPEVELCLIDPPRGFDSWDELYGAGTLGSFHKVEVSVTSSSAASMDARSADNTDLNPMDPNVESDSRYLVLVAPDLNQVVYIQADEQEDSCGFKDPQVLTIPEQLGQLRDATLADVRHNGRIDSIDEPQAELVVLTDLGIWIGDLDGNFEDVESRAYEEQFNSGVIRAADLDGDGLTELIWSSESQIGIHRLRTSLSRTDTN